ncbi:hypothetical protein K0M31_017692, partial [Melipona bicolor]
PADDRCRRWATTPPRRFGIRSVAASYIGRHEQPTVIGVDHSILCCKLSAPETHIRALPVLPGSAPGEEESGERAAWLNGPVQERARDPNSIDRLKERQPERRRKGWEREKGARDMQERIVERRGRRSDRQQQQARFRLIAPSPSRAARVIIDLVENGASPVRYPGAPRILLSVL